MTIPVSEQQLGEAIEDILRTHGPIGDLPLDVADSIANAHYRFRVCAAMMHSPLDPRFVEPFVGTLSNGNNGKKLMGFAVTTSTHLRIVAEVVPAIRKARIESPEVLEQLYDFLVDQLKSDITAPTRIQRFLKKKFAPLPSITDLVQRMAMKDPRVFGPVRR